MQGKRTHGEGTRVCSTSREIPFGFIHRLRLRCTLLEVCVLCPSRGSCASCSWREVGTHVRFDCSAGQQGTPQVSNASIVRGPAGSVDGTVSVRIDQIKGLVW